MRAFGRMFLVTRDGKHLAISPGAYGGSGSGAIRLYQELCPIHPTLVSKLQPDAFTKFITNLQAAVRVPRILFTDLVLGQIADPVSEIAPGMLPYSDIGSIRDAVDILKRSKRDTLVVDRVHPSDFFYRTVGEGFFLGDAERVVHYPFPTHEERETSLHDWWRSAELS